MRTLSPKSQSSTLELQTGLGKVMENSHGHSEKSRSSFY